MGGEDIRTYCSQIHPELKCPTPDGVCIQETWRKPCPPRVLRRSFPTHLLQAGYDIRTVPKTLGDANVHTTTIDHVPNTGKRRAQSAGRDGRWTRRLNQAAATPSLATGGNWPGAACRDRKLHGIATRGSSLWQRSSQGDGLLATRWCRSDLMCDGPDRCRKRSRQRAAMQSYMIRNRGTSERSKMLGTISGERS